MASFGAYQLDDIQTVECIQLWKIAKSLVA